MKIQQGDVLSYHEMCQTERTALQRGMNFRPAGRRSVILMSRRRDAPYADRIEDGGRVLIYEGHDQPARKGGPDPKTVDQPDRTPQGRSTQNGQFVRAAKLHRERGVHAELVWVYEKLEPGIWTFNGVFRLVDGWKELSGQRRVFKFRLELLEDTDADARNAPQDLVHNRLIPSEVKLAVWKRDNGRCVLCGRTDNLHFDHVVPFSRGGSSLVAENIQLLCARHNLAKSDRIE